MRMMHILSEYTILSAIIVSVIPYIAGAIYSYMKIVNIVEIPSANHEFLTNGSCIAYKALVKYIECKGYAKTFKKSYVRTMTDTYISSVPMTFPMRPIFFVPDTDISVEFRDPSDSTDRSKGRYRPPEYVAIVKSRRFDTDRIIEELRRIEEWWHAEGYDKESRSDPRVYYADDGMWLVACTMRSIDRPPEIVHERSHEIYVHIDRFLSSDYKTMCYKLGKPWTMGILLHGPPGTGKTTIIKGVAQRYGMDLYTINMSCIQSDVALIGLFARVPPRSVICIEDIDTCDTHKLSISGILNAIDGAIEVSGRILIITSNDRSVIPASVLRKGRIDHEILVDNVSTGHIAYMFRQVFDDRTLAESNIRPARIADVSDIMFQNLGDPDGAERALIDMDRDVIMSP